MPVGRANDVSPWLGRNWIVGAALVGVAGLLFVALNLELDRSLLFFFPPLRLPALSLLWIAMCVVLLRTYRAEPNDVLLVVLGLFVAGMVVKLFYFDLMAWNVTWAMCYGGRDYSFLDGAMRLLDFGAVIAFLACGYFLLAGKAGARFTPAGFAVAALVLLFVFSSLEVNTFLGIYVPGLRPGGVSILWSVFALALILPGIWNDYRALRYAGLALFAVVAWKVLFSDLTDLLQVYRIVAFILLGLLVLSGSFVYLKYRPVPPAVKKEEDKT